MQKEQTGTHKLRTYTNTRKRLVTCQQVQQLLTSRRHHRLLAFPRQGLLILYQVIIMWRRAVILNFRTWSRELLNSYRHQEYPKIRDTAVSQFNSQFTIWKCIYGQINLLHGLKIDVKLQNNNWHDQNLLYQKFHMK